MNLSRYSTLQSVFLIILTSFLINLSSTGLALAQPEKIAILPFEIHSEKNMDYIKAGIFQMLSSRLFSKELVMVVPREDINRITLRNKDVSQGEFFKNIGQDTGSNYVLMGSITEFEDAFSLDTKILDIKKGLSRTFFTQAGTLDQIIPQLTTLSTEINKEIFNRYPSSAQETMGKTENQSKQESLRANPETLVPQEFFQKHPDKKPFWKFWGKE